MGIVAVTIQLLNMSEGSSLLLKSHLRLGFTLLSIKALANVSDPDASPEEETEGKPLLPEGCRSLVQNPASPSAYLGYVS